MKILNLKDLSSWDLAGEHVFWRKREAWTFMKNSYLVSVSESYINDNFRKQTVMNGFLHLIPESVPIFVLCVRHAEGGVSQCFVLQNTDRRVARSSPTRWDDFVRGDSSGARPDNILCVIKG
jgi:hypothetical protein